MRPRVVLVVMAAGSLILPACGGLAETVPPAPAQKAAPSEPGPACRAVRPGDPWIPGQVEGSANIHGDFVDSVGKLIRGSDLIILGAVRGSTVGKVFADDCVYPTVHVHTAVAVEEVLKGAAPEEITVITNELGFTAPAPNKEWRVPGLRVLLFLMPSREADEPALYILAGLNYAQTAYIVRGQDIELTTPHEIYRIAEQVAAMSLTELREAVRDGA